MMCSLYLLRFERLLKLAYGMRIVIQDIYVQKRVLETVRI